MTTYSINTFTVAGGQDTYDLSFEGLLTNPPGYIEEDHVKYYIGDIVQDDADRTFPTSTTVTIDPVPADGTVISFRRETSPTAALVDWLSGLPVTEVLLDKVNLQYLYLTQESSDRGTIDVGDAGDSATNAAISAAAALASEVAAALSETNAGTAKTNAETAQTGAETAETNAETAQTAAELAETGAEAAEQGAEDALTAAGLPTSSADEAGQVLMVNSLETAWENTFLAAANQIAFFEYKDTDEIYLSSGRYVHHGSLSRNLYWVSKLTHAFTSLAASDWSYLYIDDSAITSNLLTDSELYDSVTPPVWSVSKGGWYLGEDQCIFGVLTNASSEILEFHQAGRYVQWATSVTEIDAFNYSNTFVDLIMTAPAFCNKVDAYIRFSYNSGQNLQLLSRPKGSDGDGIIIGQSTGSQLFSSTNPTLLVDDDQTLQIAQDSTGGNETTVVTNGWYFGRGI